MSKLKRYVARAETQLRAAGGGRDKLHGHAAVFDQVADLGYMFESLDAGSFDEVLARPDTDPRALFNHDPTLLLGRLLSGTLRVSVDSVGLEYEVDLPNTTTGNDVRELVERGDITQCSFGFVPGDMEMYRDDQGRDVVIHTRVEELFDVSPVTYPAYTGTDVALRALDLGTLTKKLPESKEDTEETETDKGGAGGQQRRRESTRSTLIRARARVLLGRQ